VADDALRLPAPPAPLAERLEAGGTIAWREPLTIRTYEPGEPDRYPMFLDRRVYQGSSGKVYPIPFTDRIETEPTDRVWDAIHLENSWIRLVVLPELGGRIHIGYDKSADYDFFYRNNVIKPALVGLAGPWISGGVEFNWPQHHRPATFLPVDVEIEESDDGAVTVWCSDHDPFTRMKGMHGVRLHADRALVELQVRLHNRTPMPQTFLWWANVAARVHDEYQSFFPTDVRYVADHARRAITAFPAADRPYYGVDYSARTAKGDDRIDFYRNIPVPTSYMVTDTRDDFFGGYDHRAGAGFVHVADRHIAPGKKQWTWGNAPFGHAWDRLLTDGDGPYVELMAGVYTDNQPDFAWLEPGETKQFRQLWYPISAIGPAHQANEDAAVRLDVEGDAQADRTTVRIGVAVTAERPRAGLVLRQGVEVRWTQVVDLGPASPFVVEVGLDGQVAATDLTVEIRHDDATLLEWSPRPDVEVAEPWTASEPPVPSAIGSADELYLTGVHLAQYRHPTRSPLPYWEEALRRDPGDARCNVAMADRRLRSGEYDLAEAHLRRAIARLTVRNGNPRDGEAHYLLGLVLSRTGRVDEAIDSFAKAAWDGRLVAPALGEAARLEARIGHDIDARRHVDNALATDPLDSRSRALSIVLARRLGDLDRAIRELEVWRGADPLDQLARALAGATLSADGRTLVDIALDLAQLGEIESALALLRGVADGGPQGISDVRPIARYLAAALLERIDRRDEAAAERRMVATMSLDRCFPHGLDEHDALQAALAAEPRDQRAAALLGMLLFDAGRLDEALGLWRRALDIEPDPVTLRNAAIASVNLVGDTEQASTWYHEALLLAPTDARLVYELDQLMARTAASPDARVEFLEGHLALALSRDDATVTLCELLVEVGRADDAHRILAGREFAPWEGGEGKTLAAWDDAAIALADVARARGDLKAALEYLDGAMHPPANLGEARHLLAPTAHLQMPRAEVLDLLGEHVGASEARMDAATHPVTLAAASDGRPDYFATSLPELLLFTPLGVDARSAASARPDEGHTRPRVSSS
jgi:tetratricopeptide (TPR) repeat protein